MSSHTCRSRADCFPVESKAARACLHLPAAFRRRTGIHFSGNRHGSSAAGFTLIEVLVAVVVVAALLGAIGGVIATTVKGTRSIDARLSLIQIAHRILAALPDRDALQPGTSQTGVSENYSWRIDVAPFATQLRNSNESKRWIPLAVTLRLQLTDGPVLRLDTIRLVRRSGE
jgi:general secretion pathway protein I